MSLKETPFGKEAYFLSPQPQILGQLLFLQWLFHTGLPDGDISGEFRMLRAR